MAVKSKHKKEGLTANFILKINNALLKKFGEPVRNLNSEPLDILIATILSQNTNDINSHKAFLNLKKYFKSYDEILTANISIIENLIKVAGLGKQKAKTIKNFLKRLKKETGKLELNFLKDYTISDALNYLRSYQGIGLKTSACVLLFGLNINVCPVDTHVHRTLNRIGVLNTKERDKTFYFLLKNLPEGIAHQFHTNLIKLGRTYCTSQKPKCFECPLKKICKYKWKNLDKNDFVKKVSDEKRDFMLLDSV